MSIPHATTTSAAMLPTIVAVSIASLTVGYFLGMGRSLLSYNANTRRVLSTSSDSSDLDSEDELAAISDNYAASGSGLESEECKMILAVRMDIKMEKGKIAAQCGHATLAAYKLARRVTPKFVKQWERRGQAKVAVKCPDEETMLALEKKAGELGIAARSIVDAGRTQVAPNTRTVLGLGPAPVSLMNQLTGNLKLL